MAGFLAAVMTSESCAGEHPLPLVAVGCVYACDTGSYSCLLCNEHSRRHIRAIHCHLANEHGVCVSFKAIRSYWCFECGTAVSDLKQHANGHTGKTPFKCVEPGCDGTFKNKAALRRHREKNHNRHSVSARPLAGLVAARDHTTIQVPSGLDVIKAFYPDLLEKSSH